jgi:hypothetical protein
MARLFLSIWLFRVAVAIAVYYLGGIATDGDSFSQLCHFLRVPDALGYHYKAIDLTEHLVSLEHFIRLLAVRPWEALLSGLYFLVAPHPLVAAVFCQTCLALAGILAYGTARAVGQSKKSAAFIALLIGLWPPSFAYTLVPLRDGPVLLGIFLFLTGIIRINSLNKLLTAKAACWSLAVIAGFLLIAGLRHYLWPLVLAVGAISLLWPVAIAFYKHRNLSIATNTILVAILVAIGIFAAGYWQDKMLPRGAANNPPQTEIGKYKSIPSPLQPQASTSNPLVQPFRYAFYSLMLRREGFIMTGGNTLSPEAKELRRYLGFVDDNQVLRRKQWKAAILKKKEPEAGRPQYAVLGKYRYIFWHKPSDLGHILPTSLLDLWLYPLPWQLFSNSSSLPVSLFLLAQELLWLGLLPGILFGLMNFNAGALHRVNLNLWIWCLGILLAVVVVNLGTLFRLRDMALLPAIMFWSAAPYVHAILLFKRMFR